MSLFLSWIFLYVCVDTDLSDDDIRHELGGCEKGLWVGEGD